MKSTALVVLVALLMASDFGVNAIQTHNLEAMETLTDKKKNPKKGSKSKKHTDKKKDDKKAGSKDAKKEASKKDEPKEDAPEDEAETATEATALSGADEDEIIDS